jgi:hypothetical protein
MITLALAGKLPVSEDALTAALLDALRYSNSVALVQQLLLAGATPLIQGAVLPQFDGFEVEPWPPLRGREVDARLMLTSNGITVCRLLVEAKLGAGKSGEGPIDEATRVGDQLAYYLRAESLDHPGEPVVLLYLTHHAAMPHEGLAASAKELVSAGHPELVRALFWTSWRDVEQRLRSLGSRSHWLEDLLSLLMRARMRRFLGIDLRPSAPVTVWSASFYAGKPKAGYPDPLTAPSLGMLSDRWPYQRRYFGVAPLGSLAAATFYRST